MTNATNLFYHATLIENKESIMTKGITPAIGEHSQMVNEEESQVYLFNSMDDLNTALGQWFGELFEDDDELIIFEVKLSVNDAHLTYNDSSEDYESTYSQTIEPSSIVGIYTELEFGNKI